MIDESPLCSVIRLWDILFVSECTGLTKTNIETPL